jgi:hypothetical protein
MMVNSIKSKNNFMPILIIAGVFFTFGLSLGLMAH